MEKERERETQKKMARERKRVGERKREFVCRSNRVREKVER